MFEPSATTIGYAERYGRGCMRITGEGAAFPARTFTYPGDGTSGVPPGWETGEIPFHPREALGLPAPVGTTMIIWRHDTTLDEWGDPQLTDVVAATVTGPTGPRPVGTLNSSSRTPDGAPWLYPSMVVPHRPLKSETAYVMNLRFADGSEQNVSFRTGRQPAYLRPVPGAKAEGENLRLWAGATLNGANLVLRAYDPDGRPLRLRPDGPNGRRRATARRAGRYRVCVRIFEDESCRTVRLKADQRTLLSRSGRTLIVRSGPARGTVRTATVMFLTARYGLVGAEQITLNGTRRLRIPARTSWVRVTAPSRGRWREVNAELRW